MTYRARLKITGPGVAFEGGSRYRNGRYPGVNDFLMHWLRWAGSVFDVGLPYQNRYTEVRR